jgi:hypothetical protein
VLLCGGGLTTLADAVNFFGRAPSPQIRARDTGYNGAIHSTRETGALPCRGGGSACPRARSTDTGCTRCSGDPGFRISGDTGETKKAALEGSTPERSSQCCASDPFNRHRRIRHLPPAAAVDTCTGVNRRIRNGKKVRTRTRALAFQCDGARRGSVQVGDRVAQPCSVVRTRDRVAGAGYACSARPDLHTVCRSFPKISSALSAKVCGGSRSAKSLIRDRRCHSRGSILQRQILAPLRRSL